MYGQMVVNNEYRRAYTIPLNDSLELAAKLLPGNNADKVWSLKFDIDDMNLFKFSKRDWN